MIDIAKPVSPLRSTSDVFTPAVTSPIQPPVRIWTDNADLLNPALLAGQGLAIQPEFLVWRELRDGKLAVAMPDWTVTPLGLHLVMPPSPLRSLRVQVLIDHLARELASAPWSCG